MHIACNSSLFKRTHIPVRGRHTVEKNAVGERRKRSIKHQVSCTRIFRTVVTAHRFSLSDMGMAVPLIAGECALAFDIDVCYHIDASSSDNRYSFLARPQPFYIVQSHLPPTPVFSIFTRETHSLHGLACQERE